MSHLLPETYTIIHRTPILVPKPIRKQPSGFHVSPAKSAWKNQINHMLDQLLPYTAAALKNLTLKQTPWQQAYRKNQRRVIQYESIYQFFTKEEESSKL